MIVSTDAPSQADPSSDLARTRLREGDVRGALEALRERLRREPTVAALRVFYFQLLVVCGDWDRAVQQLDTLKTLGPEHIAFVSVYGNAVRAERERISVLASGATPHVLGQPLAWMAPLIESMRQLTLNNFASAASLRDEAFDQAPALAGIVHTETSEIPFAWIADSDTRFGPVLEVFHRDRYAWLPWQYIQRIDIPVPTDLRDMVWTPVELTLANGSALPTLVPSRYVGSESAYSAIQLAHRTDWQELSDQHWIGLGQKELVTDQDQYSLLSLRAVDLAPTGLDETGGMPQT